MMTLDEQWNSYKAKLLRTATPDQLLQLRMAFMAGALSCYLIVARDLPEDEAAAMKVLGDLDAELMAVPNSVQIEADVNAVLFGKVRSHADPS